MFGVQKVPEYVADTAAAAARLQEVTSPDQYAAIVGRAQRLLDGMFTVEVNLDPELLVKIAIRERFDGPRVKQAILTVATWQLIHDLAGSWSVRGKRAAAASRPSATLASA
jgi:hypothetical protein